MTIAQYRYHTGRCNRYHANIANGTACIAANGTKISVLQSSKRRKFTLPSPGTVLDSLPQHGSSYLSLLFIQ